jgi:hypothetical protein
MINFNHYLEFSKKFEDVLTKMKEDGEIFSTSSFGKMEELISKWLKECGGNIGEDDLRVLTTYLLGNILKPEDYFKELRFLHEEIRLRELVKSFKAISPFMDMMAYTSHYSLGDPKKGFTNEKFLQGIIDSIGDVLKNDTFHDIYANLKAKNYNNKQLKKFLDGLKSSTELLK